MPRASQPASAGVTTTEMRQTSLQDRLRLQFAEASRAILVAAPPLSRRPLVVAMVGTMLIFGYAFATLEYEASLKRLIEESDDVKESISQTAELQKQANPFSAVAHLGMGAVGVAAILLAPAPQARMRWTPLLLVGAYGGLAMASAAWSAEIGFTVRRSVALGLMITSAIGMSRLVTLRQLAFILVGIGLVYTGVGVFAEHQLGTLTPWSSQYRFGGVQHPNAQAMASSLAILGCFIFHPEATHWRLLAFAIIAISVLVLVMTKSRTAAAATLATVAAAQTLRSGVSGTFAVSVFGAMLLGGTLLAIGYVSQTGVKSASSVAVMGRGKDIGSLTGRIPLWTHLLALSQAHPIEGAGYGAFWDEATSERISHALGWNVTHAHSIYIQTYLELGLTGLAVLLVMLAYGLATSLQDYWRTRDPAPLYAGAVVVLAIVHGVAETSFATRQLPFFALIAVLGYLAWAPVRGAAPAADRVGVQHAI